MESLLYRYVERYCEEIKWHMNLDKVLVFEVMRWLLLFDDGFMYGNSGLDDTESACHAGDLSLIPGSGSFPEEGNGYPPTPAFLPGESHEQRSLADCSP